MATAEFSKFAGILPRQCSVCDFTESSYHTKGSQSMLDRQGGYSKANKKTWFLIKRHLTSTTPTLLSLQHCPWLLAPAHWAPCSPPVLGHSLLPCVPVLFLWDCSRFCLHICLNVTSSGGLSQTPSSPTSHLFTLFVFVVLSQDSIHNGH